MPVSLTSEIARLENIDGQRMHDLDMARKVSSISKIVMASSAEVWLIHCPGPAFNHFYSMIWKGSTSANLRKYSTHHTKTLERKHPCESIQFNRQYIH